MLQRVSLLSEEQAYKTWGGSSSLQDLRAATGRPSAPALSWPGGRSPFAYGTVTKPLLYTEMFAFPVFWESFSGENPPSTPDMGSLWTSHPLFFSFLLHCGLRCSLGFIISVCWVLTQLQDQHIQSVCCPTTSQTSSVEMTTKTFSVSNNKSEPERGQDGEGQV